MIQIYAVWDGLFIIKQASHPNDDTTLCLFHSTQDQKDTVHWTVYHRHVDKKT